MPVNKVRLRRLHATLVPFMALPLILTLLTGLMFHIAALSGKGSDFYWLLELHQGKFGRIDLSIIYPFLNAFGLLTLVVTGAMMWMQLPRRRAKG